MERCLTLKAFCVQLGTGLDEVDGHGEVSEFSGQVKSSVTTIFCYRHVGFPVQQDPHNARVTLPGSEHERSEAFGIALVDDVDRFRREKGYRALSRSQVGGSVQGIQWAPRPLLFCGRSNWWHLFVTGPGAVREGERRSEPTT